MGRLWCRCSLQASERYSNFERVISVEDLGEWKCWTWELLSCHIILFKSHRVKSRYTNYIVWIHATSIASCEIKLHKSHLVKWRYRNQIAWNHLTQITLCKITHVSKSHTVEPRFNEPLYNEVLGITNHFLHPGQNYSKMYWRQPRFNEPPFNEILVITNKIHKPKKCLDITNKCHHAIKDKCQTDQQR